MSKELPLINCTRLRMEVDGDGVTTLVAAKGCPLSCRYCINAGELSDATPFRYISASELLEQVRIDDLYFQATGGGIAFGGGESLLHADFIEEFAKTMPEGWKLTVETCLNVPETELLKVIPYVDMYIVDIKDMNPEIYQAYTGKSNERVVENLRLLVAKGVSDRVKVRIPLIPGFNTREDCERSLEAIRHIGSFRQLDVFSYVKTDG